VAAATRYGVAEERGVGQRDSASVAVDAAATVHRSVVFERAVDHIEGGAAVDKDPAAKICRDVAHERAVDHIEGGAGVNKDAAAVVGGGSPRHRQSFQRQNARTNLEHA
jgi:hypothetical protein